MKINFKKIATVLGSALMIGSTMGIAAAAAFPAPFVQGGAANVAVVVGSNAALSDGVAAVSLGSNLASSLAAQAGTTSSGGATAAGGDSYEFEKPSTKLSLGRGLKDVVTVDLTSDSLPVLLKDGKFLDADNDEFDYTQKIAVSNSSVSLFDDNDYKQDAPTIGIKIANGANVLNYTLDFSDEPTWDDLATATLPFMGRSYYILSASNATAGSEVLTLLDSASEYTLKEGESTTLTVNGKTFAVSVGYISSTEVRLVINDEQTTSLLETETYKLKDGSFVGIKDIMYNAKDAGISSVEFSIGAGKLKLTNNTDVQLNDETISDLTVTIGCSAVTKLTSIKISWDADSDQFIAPNSSIEMPGFKAVKLNWAGMNYPANEVVSVEAGSSDYIVLKQFPLKTSTEDIAIVYYNGTQFSLAGRDSDELLRGPGTGAVGVSDGANGTIGNITFDGDTDSYFVVSWNDTASAESYLLRATNFRTESGTEKVDFQSKVGGTWTDLKTGAKNGTTFSIGSAELTAGPVSRSGKTVVIKPGSGVNFNVLYSKTGLKVLLPWVNTTTLANDTNPVAAECVANITANVKGQLASLVSMGLNLSCSNYNGTYTLWFTEEDKDGNVGVGRQFSMNLSANSNAEAHVATVDGEDVSFAEIGDTDTFLSAIYSALATTIFQDRSGDQYKVAVTYHGDESYAQVFITAPETTVTEGVISVVGTTQLGSITVEDTDFASVSSKNLIVVGGSCINTIAAKLLGSTTPLCSAEFTTATGVADGQFLIQVFDAATAGGSTGKVAMLVAGYNAADTTKAVTYLTNNAIDSTVGTKIKKVSSTFADVA